ncbi:MAG: efflux RND transporter periplasmic adaptor subunit [Chthonomonadales bacterium]
MRGIILLACGGLTGALLWGCGRGAAAPESSAGANSGAPVVVDTSTVQRRTIEVLVPCPGTLVPSQGASARVAPPFAGRVKAVFVREGDRVAAGQVLAELESRTLAAQSRSASAALAAAERQAQEASLAARAAAADHATAVEAAKIALKAAKLDRDAGIQQARIALDAAEADLRKLKSGARPQEIAQAEQAVLQAEANRDRAAQEARRTKNLYAKGIDSRRQMEDADTALRVAQAALESARQQEALLKAGNRPEDIQAAELRVQSAREALAQARAAGDAHVAQAEAALQQAQQGAAQVAVKEADARAFQALVMQKQADLAAAGASAGYARLTSPVSGIVTRRFLNPGDMADPNTPVLEVMARRSLDLVCSASPDAASKLRVGMLARVHAPGDTPKTAVGRVISVGQVDPQTNLLAVRITLEHPDGNWRAGAFATADVVTEVHRAALVVPARAVIQRGGRDVVFVVAPDGTAHVRPVSVGARNGDWIEVSGVTPGDKVITVGQYELADGAKVVSSKGTGPAQ